MSSTRRQFVNTMLGAMAAGAIANAQEQATPASASTGTPATPGAPPTFASAPEVGPPVSPATFAEAEKLMQVSLTAAERAQAAESWRKMMAPLYERRTGPHTIQLEDTLAPYSRWNPVLPGQSA